MKYSIVSLAERPDLAARLPFGAGWPKFIFHDPIAQQHLPTANAVFADLNLVILEERGTIVAGGWAVPLTWDATTADLPDGWDGALVRAIEDHEAGRAPTALATMGAEVDASHRGQGLSRLVLGALRDCAAARGLGRMIAPVRPTLKARYPLTPMERYVRWTLPDGSPFDPWIRTHCRLGAEILAVAPRSMVITGRLAEWEEWTGMSFPESGRYVVPEALDLARFIHRRHTRQLHVRYAAELSAFTAAGGPVICVLRLRE